MSVTELRHHASTPTLASSNGLLGVGRCTETVTWCVVAIKMTERELGGGKCGETPVMRLPAIRIRDTHPRPLHI